MVGSIAARAVTGGAPYFPSLLAVLVFVGMHWIFSSLARSSASFSSQPHGKIADWLPIQSPYVSIANRQAEIMMRIASEFSFTPASRSQISAPAEAGQLPLFEADYGGPA
jgi:hypothetical protein